MDRPVRPKYQHSIQKSTFFFKQWCIMEEYYIFSDNSYFSSFSLLFRNNTHKIRHDRHRKAILYKMRMFSRIAVYLSCLHNYVVCHRLRLSICVKVLVIPFNINHSFSLHGVLLVWTGRGDRGGSIFGECPI